MSKPYHKYKNSDVEWLGKVPEHWELSKLKKFTKFVGGGTPSRDNLNFWAGEIPWVSPKDMKSERLSDAQDHISEEGLASSSTSMVPTDCVLMVVRSGILQHTVPVAINTVPVALNQDMKALSFLPTKCLPEFFFRWVQGFNDELLLGWRKQGATVESIEHSYLIETIVPLPDIEEQKAIIAFLDAETAKIDALEEEQRKLIELLKEKRQAVISHTVTKGLNPNAPTKDSGIAWLGKVPEHWDVRPLKKLLGEPLTYGANEASDDDTPGNPRYVRITDIGANGLLREDTFRSLPDKVALPYLLKESDILLARSGATVGKSFIYRSSWGVCCYAGYLIRARCNQKIVHPNFLYAYCQSDFFWQHIKSEQIQATIQNVSAERYANLWVTQPPIEEQEEIAQHLDALTQETDQLVLNAETAITLLQERRAALISAAVTGKIDVRVSSNVIPFSGDRARARTLVGIEIIERFQSDVGHKKLQKAAYLAEAHVGVHEIEGTYDRAAAGPYDRVMLEEIDKGVTDLFGVCVEQPRGHGTTVTYKLPKKRGRHKAELSCLLGAKREEKLTQLLTDLAELSATGTEVVATLYAVWNDALIEGLSPNDDLLVDGFLNDWHPEKRERFRDTDELHRLLGWMRRHGLIPTGQGPKTRRTRLVV